MIVGVCCNYVNHIEQKNFLFNLTFQSGIKHKSLIQNGTPKSNNYVKNNNSTTEIINSSEIKKMKRLA